MTGMTVLMKALPALARPLSGTTISAGPVATPASGTTPVTLTEAELDHVAGGDDQVPVSGDYVGDGKDDFAVGGSG